MTYQVTHSTKQECFLVDLEHVNGLIEQVSDRKIPNRLFNVSSIYNRHKIDNKLIVWPRIKCSYKNKKRKFRYMSFIKVRKTLIDRSNVDV